MVIRMSKKRQLENLSKLKDYKSFENEFQNESDRAAAILGASLLEVRLEECIKEFLINDKEVQNFLNGYLRNIKSRASLAFCLGLISKNQLKDIEIVAEIRNDFAHNLQGLDFNDSTISKKCRELNSPREIISEKFFGFTSESVNSRSLYSLAISFINNQIEIQRLNTKVSTRKLQKLKEPKINL